MSDSLKEKHEFVKKMKEENPRAFEFLAGASINLLANLESDIRNELSEWAEKSVKVCGLQKTRDMLLTKHLELGRGKE